MSVPEVVQAAGWRRESYRRALSKLWWGRLTTRSEVVESCDVAPHA
ncbi:hypothetical protein ACFQ8C_29590 [Streptomyces sp. NPDC056503]